MQHAALLPQEGHLFPKYLDLYLFAQLLKSERVRTGSVAA